MPHDQDNLSGGEASKSRIWRSFELQRPLFGDIATNQQEQLDTR